MTWNDYVLRPQRSAPGSIPCWKTWTGRFLCHLGQKGGEGLGQIQMDDVRDCQSNCLKMTTCLSEFNWPELAEKIDGPAWPGSDFLIIYIYIEKLSSLSYAKYPTQPILGGA